MKIIWGVCEHVKFMVCLIVVKSVCSCIWLPRNSYTTDFREAEFDNVNIIRCCLTLKRQEEWELPGIGNHNSIMNMGVFKMFWDVLPYWLLRIKSLLNGERHSIWGSGSNAIDLFSVFLLNCYVPNCSVSVCYSYYINLLCEMFKYLWCALFAVACFLLHH
jgi:hypothetical protein